MTENNQSIAGTKDAGIAQPARRKLEVRRETVKDLTPETRSAAKVKGGIPQLTNNGADPNFRRDL